MAISDREGRRRFVKAGSAGLGSAALVGLTGKSGPAAAQTGRTLTVAWDTDIDTLDPTVYKSMGGAGVTCNVYDSPLTWAVRPVAGLDGVFRSPPMQYDGNVVESWSFEHDGATVLLHVRRGMTFPSGRPITAHSVKFMLDRAMLSSGYMRFTVPTMLRVKGPDDVIVRDPATVEIRMPSPSPMALEVLSLMTLGILDEELVRSKATADDPWAGNWLRHNEAGSGPYRLVRNTPGVEVVLEARERHWAGRPAFERIVFKFVPSEADRVLLLRRRAVDMVVGSPGLTPRSVLALKDDPNLRTVSVPDTNGHWLCINQSRPVLDNVLVRRAINYAIPIQAIIPNVLQGFGTPMKSPLSSLTPGYDGTLSPYTYDLEKARALMKEAGHAGRTIPVKLAVRTGWSSHEQAAIWIQQSLQQIGFQVTIEKQTDATLRQLHAKGEQELAIESFLAWVNDPFFTLNALFTSSRAGVTNTAFYRNPAFDKLIADNFHEPDPARRHAAARKAQQMLIDDAVSGFLWFDNWTRVMRRDLTGFEMRWDGQERYRALRTTP